MPSLSDALTNGKAVSSYEPVPAAPPILSILPSGSPMSTNLRFILPPFNSDPDSLRHFEDPMSGPKIRTFPRPQPKAGATSTSTGGSTSSSSSSSSSSSTTTVALMPKIATLTTGILVVPFLGSVSMSQSFQLLSLSATGMCDVRIYGTALAQAEDAYRAPGSPVPPEISPNIVACVTFDTAPYMWPFQNIGGANQASPQTTTIYVSVINTNLLIQTPITVTIVYLPLES